VLVLTLVIVVAVIAIISSQVLFTQPPTPPNPPTPPPGPPVPDTDQTDCNSVMGGLTNDIFTGSSDPCTQSEMSSTDTVSPNSSHSQPGSQLSSHNQLSSPLGSPRSQLNSPDRYDMSSID